MFIIEYLIFVDNIALQHGRFVYDRIQVSALKGIFSGMCYKYQHYVDSTRTLSRDPYSDTFDQVGMLAPFIEIEISQYPVLQGRVYTVWICPRRSGQFAQIFLSPICANQQA